MNDPTKISSSGVGYADFMALIERSSLGTPGARELRRRTPTRDALHVMAMADQGFREACADEPWLGLMGAARHEACMAAAMEGNRAAMAALVSDLTPLVWHVARAQGLSRDVAEDVVMSVWMRVFEELKHLSTARKLAGWLIVTTRRESLKTGMGNSEQVPTEQPDVESATDERAERDRRVWAAFVRLPQRCQELLRLTVLAGRAEYAVIADALHMPRGSVGPTRGRCLDKLRTLLAEDQVGRAASDGDTAESSTLFSSLSEAIDDLDPAPLEIVLYP